MSYAGIIENRNWIPLDGEDMKENQVLFAVGSGHWEEKMESSQSSENSSYQVKSYPITPKIGFI